jgi:PKD repeat protein
MYLHFRNTISNDFITFLPKPMNYRLLTAILFGTLVYASPVFAASHLTPEVKDSTSFIKDTTRMTQDVRSPIDIFWSTSDFGCAYPGKIDLGVNGDNPPFTFQWSNGAVTQSLSNIWIAGTYTVTVTDAIGQTATESGVVNGPPSNLTVTTHDVYLNCINYTAVLSATVTGGQYYILGWSGPGGFASSQPQPMVAAPGKYYVTVTDLYGCTATASAMVSPSPPILINTTVVNASSSGADNGSVTLHVCGGSPPYTFYWSNGAQTENLNPTPAGTYTVTVTDSGGCTQTASATVTQPSQGGSGIVLTAQIYPISCDTSCTGSITIDANGAQGLTYAWSGPGNFISTQQNLTQICYPGAYTVTASDNNNNLAVSVFTVNYPSTSIGMSLESSNPGYCNNPAAISAGSCEKICPHTTVTYTVDLPPYCGIYPHFYWTIYGSTSFSFSPTRDQCTVTWGEAGAGLITVLGVNDFFCFQKITHCVTIVEQPKAKIGTSPALGADGVLHVCQNQTVFFHSQSLHADLYEWSFPDNLTKSTAKDPEHAFFQAGIYKITLIASSLCLCADTTTLVVAVTDGVAPRLSCVTAICQGEPMTYHTVDFCGVYDWSVSPNGTVLAGGGIQDDSISVVWNTGPEAIIGLQVQNCTGQNCPLPAETRIPVIYDHMPIEGRTRVCPGSEEVYQTSPLGDGTYFTWTASPGAVITDGQGTNEIMVTWNSSGWLTVTYTNCYLGCSGHDTLWITVNDPMVLLGGAEDCQGTIAALLARTASINTQEVSCQWSVVQPDGVHVAFPGISKFATFPASLSGEYQVVAIPAGPGLNQTCSDSAEFKIKVAPKPSKLTGITGPLVFCPDAPLTYSVTGFAPGYNIQWQNLTPVNGTTTATGNPIVTSFSAGTPHWIAASQVTPDHLHCTSDTIQLVVHEIPPFSISGNNGVCEGALLVFSAPVFETADYQWSISPADAGVIKSGQGSHVIEVFWVKPGDHSLTVNVCGQSSVKSIKVWPSANPVVASPGGACEGSTVKASVTSFFNNYIWKNQDGLTLSNDSTISAGPGKYAVVVTDGHNCSGTAEFTIDVYPRPNISLSTADPTIFCNNASTVTMDALVNQDADYTYEWYRNALPLGVHVPVYATNQYGSYTVEAANSYGCTASSQPIGLYDYCGGGGSQPPPPPGCPPGSVQFTTDLTSRCDSFQFHLLAGPNYLPGSASWRFGQSGGGLYGTSSDDNPVFKFPNAGKYTVFLDIKLQNGAVCEVTDTVRVEASAQFSFKAACPSDSTIFKENCTFLPDGSGITSWKWDFGDPGSGPANASSLRNLRHAFDATGFYQVSLTVTTASGCTSSETRNVKVPDLPVVVFSPSPVDCAGNATHLNVLAGPDIAFVNWVFGDPSSGTLNGFAGPNAFHKYQTSGTFQANATLKNIAGCASLDTLPVVIIPNDLTGMITPADATFCEGNFITLNAPSGGTGYLWSDGSTAPGLTVGQAGVYQVTVTSANGCTYVPPSKTTKVNPAPDGQVKAVLYNDQGQVVGEVSSVLETCQGTNVHLTVSSDGHYDYSWSSGGTGSETVFSMDHGNLLQTGTHIFTVTITNAATGCTTVTTPFTVIIDPAPGGFSATVDQPCAGISSTVQYVGPQDPSWQLFWNNGITGPSFVTKKPGHYFVRAINQFGCSATSNKVTIKPGPNTTAIPSGCHKRCSPDSICFQPMPEIVSWQWYFNGEVLPGATTPNLVTTVSGGYNVLMVDTGGCQAKSPYLFVDLYPGTGDVLGKVWSDVNDNGIIDAGDTLVSGIPVHLLGGGTIHASAATGSNGKFAFQQVPTTDYDVSLDTIHLPQGWEIKIGLVLVHLVGCTATSSAELLLHKHICDTIQSTLTIPVCSGESLDYLGVQIGTGESHTFPFHTIWGCDSLLTVTAAPVVVPPAMLKVQACSGTTYAYQGVQIMAGQSQTFTLTSSTGCDSLVTVEVAAIPVGNSSFTTSICPGTTYSYQGIQIPAGQSQTFTLASSAGCDSLVTISVLSYLSDTTGLSAVICPGTKYNFLGADLDPGQQYLYHFKGHEGCDSVVILTVIAYPEISFEVLSEPSCAGKPTGSLMPKGLAGPILYSLDGVAFQSDSLFSNEPPGNYTIYVKDNHNCLFTQAALVGVLPPLEAALPGDVLLTCDSPSTRLAPFVTGDTTALRFQWSNGNQTDEIIAMEPAKIWVDITNHCETIRKEATLSLLETPDFSKIYVPNTFAPESSNPENAIFRPLFGAGINPQRYLFSIYDRWGSLIFRSERPEQGWDAITRSRAVGAGVYVWHLEAAFEYCGRLVEIKKKGDVTVVR